VENPLGDDSPFVEQAMRELGFDGDFSNLPTEYMCLVLRRAATIKWQTVAGRGGNQICDT